jgi:hypothetical protein
MRARIDTLFWMAILGLASCTSESGSGCADADGDGACDSADVCPAADDAADADGDGTPDACDACPADALADLDGDGICNSADTESCADGVDNDGDAAVDCADSACAGGEGCVPAFGSLAGIVVDVLGVPLARVRVQAGDSVTATDDGGHFMLRDLPVSSAPSLVAFALAGYGGHTRRVALRKDEVVFTQGVLKAADVLAFWQDPTAGFTVVGPSDEVRVTFPAGALRDEAGDAIAERVDVAIVTGDPTDPLEAPIMPGDYLSGENGGTPLDSVAFLDITVRTALGGEIHAVDPAAPIVVEMPVPAALQGGVAAGGTIPWWSFDESTGFWMREGTAEVFDDAGTLWVRAEATHLSWWNCDRPIDEHACVCIDVVDGAGDPIEGAQVGARGVTYQGGSSPVQTDAAGRGCVTVKNSVASAEQVDVFVHVGDVELPHPANPVVTPDVVASCLRDVDCPEKCEVLSGAIVIDRSGVVSGTVTLRSGAPAVGLWVANDHAAATETDGAGGYSLPVLLDVEFQVFTQGYSSPDLLATGASPNVVHDIALDNLQPVLVDLSVNGVPQSFDGREHYVSVAVADDSLPVDFEALAVDLDGDPVTYAWSGRCYVPDPVGGDYVVLDCSPPDAPATTCEPPVPGGAGGTQGCQYLLELDDGVEGDEPLVWTIWVYEGP